MSEKMDLQQCMSCAFVFDGVSTSEPYGCPDCRVSRLEEQLDSALRVVGAANRLLEDETLPDEGKRRLRRELRAAVNDYEVTATRLMEFQP